MHRARTPAVVLLAAAVGTLASDSTLWKDPSRLADLGNERLARSDFREGLPILQAAAALAPESERTLAALANGFHLARRLDEASDVYARLLLVTQPTTPSKPQLDAIMRFAPRVFQTRSDPFPLKDVVAVHHPAEPLIAYHFFWADDIDFPEDSDPCDHELVWVRYDASRMAVTDFHTYFHGRLLRSAAAITDAELHGERPRVNVQWGKHGSMPAGWEDLSIQANPGDVEAGYLDLAKPVRLIDYNRATHKKLSTEGRRLKDHPLGRTWPDRFKGTWDDFVSFTREVDIRQLLTQRRAMTVSKWNNAVLQQRFLAYNFRPKTEWPAATTTVEALATGLELRRATAPSTDRLIEAIAKGGALPADLPPASLFKPETPRYPNVWLHGAVTQFPTYAGFINSLNRRFQAAGYSDAVVSLNEGADLALSIEHLQPWTSLQALRHGHAIHIRFFWKRLEMQQGHRVGFGPARAPHWRVAASVHYEVENANPFHADVEVCPYCGRTGAYAHKEGNLVERVHDPLGVELLLWGTIRGETVLRTPVLNRAGIVVSGPARGDMNTEAIAVVVVEE